jgi:hypothetical protein
MRSEDRETNPHMTAEHERCSNIDFDGDTRIPLFSKRHTQEYPIVEILSRKK